MLVTNYAIAHGLSTVIGVFDKNDPRYRVLYDIGSRKVLLAEDPQ